jgi:glutathionyl-hydroquinone reductase
MPLAPRYASPVDTDRHGSYVNPQRPDDPRPLYRFQGRITEDGSTPFTPDQGRYHLYAGWFCPWSQRVTLEIALRGLTDVITVSYVDNARDARGWAFREPTGADPINAFELLRDAYDATTPGFDGHVSVPTLWDRVTGTVVSNDFRTLGIDVATRFGAWAHGPATYASADRQAIEELDSWIGPDVNQGVGPASAGDGGTRRRLLAAFARLDDLLADRRFLLGDRITEADVRLWVTLVRYDAGANAQRTINGGLAAYPNLWGYARDLYALPPFRATTDLSSFTAADAAPVDWGLPSHRAVLVTAS